MPFPHGDLLERKARTNPDLVPVLAAYRDFVDTARLLTISDEHSIRSLVSALNAYRNESIYVFEDGRNVPQSNLRSTIMEEFLWWLFKDIFTVIGSPVPSNYRIGKASGSYLSLDFAPSSFTQLFVNPNPCIHTKDQDFALGANVTIAISGDGEPFSTEVLLPVVAIECKTYLAKNHLDMCSSTATSLKRAMPYCKYIIIAEFLKMSNTVTPEFSDVSEIYIVCKAKNSERSLRKAHGQPPHIIHDDVIINLYNMVISHLRSIWWDPQSVLERGTVIGRPR